MELFLEGMCCTDSARSVRSCFLPSNSRLHSRPYQVGFLCLFLYCTLLVRSLCLLLGEICLGTTFAGQKADSLLCAGHDGIFLIGSQASRSQKTNGW